MVELKNIIQIPLHMDNNTIVHVFMSFWTSVLFLPNKGFLLYSFCI